MQEPWTMENFLNKENDDNTSQLVTTQEINNDDVLTLDPEDNPLFVNPPPPEQLHEYNLRKRKPIDYRD